MENPTLIQNNSIIAEKVVLTHMARKPLSNPLLLPNICYLNEERHSILKVPRVLVEFCLNGTITRDDIFNHFNALTLINFKDLTAENKSRMVNFWPTGTAFLGSVKIPCSSLIFNKENAHLVGFSANNSFKHPIDNTTHSDKEKMLDSLYESLETSYMKIASNYEGFQSTTWSHFPNGKDYLDAYNIDNTRTILKQFASKHAIANADSNYNYPVGRFLHRLCAFFMGFRLMAFNTYWCNYSLDRAEDAIKRFVSLFNSATSTLSNYQKESPAWKIVEQYTNVSIFIMEIHSNLYQKGLFGFEYIAKENFEHDLSFYGNFLKSGKTVGNLYGKESVLQSAEAYHFYRDTFKRHGEIDANHKLIKGFLNYGKTILDDTIIRQPKTIDDLLSLWVLLIDKKYPNFNEKVNQLIKHI